MIHLKRFNEKIQWNKDRPELLKFCEEHLAYLLDEGFDIYVRLHKMENSAYKNGIRDEGYISICYNKHPNTFKWNRIKDEFIPFLEMLIIKYNLKEEYVSILKEVNLDNVFVNSLEELESDCSGGVCPIR